MVHIRPWQRRLPLPPDTVTETGIQRFPPGKQILISGTRCPIRRWMKVWLKRFGLHEGMDVVHSRLRQVVFADSEILLHQIFDSLHQR